MAATDRALTPKVAVVGLFFVVVVPFLPLLVSARWSWWEAWVYGVLAVVSYVASRASAARRDAGVLRERVRSLEAAFAVRRASAARRDPGVLGERGRSFEAAGAESWDRPLIALIGAGSLALPLVAGLEARLGDPVGFSLAVRLCALTVLVGGYAFSSWALVENRFFSGVVRIQRERGHAVVRTGPYRVVRHPGYAGAILVYLATPLLLDSPWSFVPALLLTLVLVVRTALEDRTLTRELEGYLEYARRTRNRLLPGVW